MGCIYKHPGIHLNEFDEFYLNDLLDKLSKENETVFLLGDFNISLLNYEQDTWTNEFFWLPAFSFIFTPYTSTSKNGK